jgi:hypothetical protein
MLLMDQEIIELALDGPSPAPRCRIDVPHP